MPSTKPGPYPYVAGRALYVIVKRYLDTGNALLIQTWSKTAANWVNYVETDRDNYTIWLVPEDYPTNQSANYLLHPSDYPDWNLEAESYGVYVYEEDPTDADTGTGTGGSASDALLYLQAVGAENANVTSVIGSVLPATNLGYLMSSFRIGTVVTDAGNDANSFKTNLEQLGNDFYNNRVLTWPEGTTNETQASLVTAFDNATQIITVFPALASTPADDEQFILGGRIN